MSMKYRVRWTKIGKRYEVVNSETHLTQSSWPTRPIADEVARRLNRLAGLAVCGMAAGPVIYNNWMVRKGVVA